MKIPKGWRKLKKGEVILRGDKVHFPHLGRWEPTQNGALNFKVGDKRFGLVLAYIRKDVDKV